MLALEVLPTSIVLLTIVVLLLIRLAQFLDSHGVSHWYLIATLAGLFAVACIAEALRSLARVARERRESYERMLMQQRYPFCHVTRLSNGDWFLTDKATGREYLPPRSNKR